MTSCVSSSPADSPRMLKLLRKIRAVFLASWQDAFMYRAESFVWFVGDAVVPLVMIALWLAAYRTVDRVGAYAVEDMVNYYVMFLVLSALLMPHPEWSTSEMIRNGGISMHLLRPFPYQLFQLTDNVAWKGVRVLFLAPLLLLILLIFGPGMLSAFALSWEIAPILAVSMVLSFLLSYCLKLSLGLLAFWMSDVEGVLQVYTVGMMFMAGSIIPLDLMPPAVERVTYSLPFRYLFFFPVQLLQGRLAFMDALGGLAVQGVWLILAFLLMRWVFAVGVRRYGAYGG